MIESAKETIVASINYIENNINNNISLDDIAFNTNISKFYLHRIFKTLTGEPIMEYVLARKLSESIDELVYSDKRIIDIAMDYGFSYEQSYIRAFKKKFGCTPLKLRSDKSFLMLDLKEKIDINDILIVDNAITYKPHFSFAQKFYLVGDKHKILSKSGDKTANIYGKDFFYNHKGKVGNSINPHVYFGYTDWSGSNNGYIYYVPSVQVRDLSQIPAGMEGICVPAHKYVVFRFVGFFRPDDISGRHVGRLLVQLYSRWIKNSGYKIADTFRYEYIDTSLSKDNYCELFVFQPIISDNKKLKGLR